MLRTSLLAAVLATAGGLFVSAHAQPLAKTDQVVPDEPPIPVDGLLVVLPGVPAATAAPGVTLVAPTVTRMTAQDPDATTGPFMRFDAGRSVGEQVVITTPAIARATPAAGRTAAYSGATIALWYRHPGGTPEVGGWNPIVFAGRDATLDWTFGVVLEDGVPAVIVRRTSLERFGVVLGGGGSTLLDAIDDGAWHHIAVRLSRPGCVAGACEAPGRFLVTLVVDGAVADEAIVPLANDLDTVFVGKLVVEDDYTTQGNFDGDALNTIADLDDLHVYEAALSLAELRRTQTERERGLRFQIPPLSPSALGWNGPSPQVGLLPQTGLASRPLGGAAPLELLDLSAVRASPSLGLGRSLEGVTRHTFLVWSKLEGAANGVVFKWTPTTGAGWELFLKDGDLNVRCTSTSAVGSFPVPAGADWRLLVVRAEDDRLTLGMRGGPSVTCPVAANPAGETPSLQLVQPAAVRLAWAALYAERKAEGETWAIGSPGPALWFDPATSKHFTPDAGAPLVRVGTPGTNTFAPRQQTPGTIRYIVSDFAGGALGPELTLSFEIRIDAVDGREPLVFVGGRASAVYYELLAYFQVASADASYLVINVPQGGRMVPVRLKRPFALGKTLDVSIAWPLTRRLEPAPGTLGTPIVVTEPGFTVNGEFMNRRYANDPDPLEWLAPINYPAPFPGELRRWVFGSGDSVLTPPLATRYQLRDIRVHPRAVTDATQVGMDCPSTQCLDGQRTCAGAFDPNLRSNRCGACDMTSFSSGGVGASDPDCITKRSFHERCDSDEMCTSGACSGGVCVAETPQACEPACLAIGRTCASAAGGGFDCGACRQGFTSVPGTDAASSTAVCTWSPTLRTGERCSEDAQCISGACRETILHQQSVLNESVDTRYHEFEASEGGHCKLYTSYCRDVPERYPKFSYTQREVRAKVCLATTAEECSAAPRFASVRDTTWLSLLPNGKAPPYGESLRYACDNRASGACRPNFTRTNGVLTPGACQAAATRALTQVQSGRCHEDGPWAWDCDITERPTFQWPNPANASWMRTTNLSLRDLKILFLADDSNYHPATDYGRLRQAGVGPLLIAYAGASDTERAEMVAQHGSFEPIWHCGHQDVVTSAYHREANYASCAPLLQADGAKCPPAGAESLSLPPSDYCLSGYCSRDDRRCERGDNPLREIRPSAANQNRSGKASVKFGLVRVDDTRVEMERPADQGPLTEASANADSNEVREYEAWVNQSHVLCILGRPFPSQPLFETRLHLDRQAVEACSTADVSTFVLGMKLTGPAPGPIAGSCTGYASAANGASWDACLSPTSCQAVDPDNLVAASSLAQMAIPELVFCAPLTDDAGEDLLPELRKDFKEFLVPLYISFGPTLDLCFKLAVGLDDGGMPQLQMTPNVGVGVEAKAAVGSAETGAYEFGIGIRLAVTIIDIAFPITWGFAIEDGMNAAGQPVFGLLELQVIQKLALELTILSGEFGLFAAFEIGPFAFEWTINIFTWAGIEFAFDLANTPLLRTKLDFTARFAGALESGAAQSQCNAAPTAPCYQ